MSDIIEILLWISAGIWTLFLIQSVLNVLLVPDLSRVQKSALSNFPLVSYVVPARNEQQDIGESVPTFCAQSYPQVEVIVVNDRSTDQTGELLAELSKNNPRLTVVEGTDPPPGWLGKPNALQRGAEHARGDWILMADADSRHAPDILERAMALAERDNAGMVVVRPRHITSGFFEAVLMSAINFFFFAATPAFLVRYSRSSLFSTGSPVFNLIRRDAFEACGGFACLKQAIVDDLEIGFWVKRAGYRVAVAFSGELINHRMYRGVKETIQGFGKTTYPTIRRVPWILPLYYLVGITVSLLPYWGVLDGWITGHVSLPAWLALGGMHLVMGGVAWRYREPWYITFCNPLRELGWLWIFTRSFVLFCRNGLVWRGRSYPAST